jgi:hypothetical protein
VPPSPHPNKEIRAALAYAVAAGWVVVEGRGHCWGMIRCPHRDAECRCGEFCQISIWSTPRVPEHEAAKIRRCVDHCIHRDAGKKGSKER